MKMILTLLIYALSPILIGTLYWSLLSLLLGDDDLLVSLGSGFAMSIYTEILFFPAAFLTGIVDVLSVKNRKFRILTAGFIFSAITISIVLATIGFDMFLTDKVLAVMGKFFHYIQHIICFGLLGMGTAYCINWKEFRNKKDDIKRKD